MSLRGSSQPSPELPEAGTFEHVVLRIPDVAGGMICDPTTGSPCAGLPSSLSGVRGLALRPGGAGDLIRLPDARPEENTARLELDVTPAGDALAQIKVRARYTGRLADHVRGRLQQTDPKDVENFVERSLGYGLWPTCRQERWALERDDCDGIVLTAEFADTAWSQPGQNTLQFRLETEVADPWILYPPKKDRVHPVEMLFPFRGEALLRFHPGAGWEADTKLAEVRVRSEGCEGRIEALESGEAGACEVHESFELSRMDFSAEEYGRYFDNWVRFRVGLNQPFAYRRALLPEELEKLRAYIREHPEDAGFAFQAAARLLGTDAGGKGDSGANRRRTAREFLTPIASDGATGTGARFLLAIIALVEKQYTRADSLLTRVIEASPDHPLAAPFAIRIKRDLGRRAEVIEILHRLSREARSAGTELELMTELYAAERDSEAAEVESRYALLHGVGDSSRVLLARLTGLISGERCAEADLLLERVRPLLDADRYRLFDSSVKQECERNREALPLLEELWAENPLEPVYCNNLAWALAILGGDLERAEELARQAIILSLDESGAENTLGAIYARRGEWERAREIFLRLAETDDRPETRMINEYFTGLCDYQLGRHDAARSAWSHALQIATSRLWRQRIQRSIELANTSGDVTEPIFQKPETAVSGP